MSLFRGKNVLSLTLKNFFFSCSCFFCCLFYVQIAYFLRFFWIFHQGKPAFCVFIALFLIWKRSRGSLVTPFSILWKMFWRIISLIITRTRGHQYKGEQKKKPSDEYYNKILLLYCFRFFFCIFEVRKWIRNSQNILCLVCNKAKKIILESKRFKFFYGTRKKEIVFFYKPGIHFFFLTKCDC